jgi:hypothetical protein
MKYEEIRPKVSSVEEPPYIEMSRRIKSPESEIISASK